MLALIVKEFRELARDRRTLAMLVVLPIVLLVIFGYAANFSVERITVTVVGAGADSVAGQLARYDTATSGLEVVGVDPSLSADDAAGLLRDQRSDAVIVATAGAGQDAGSSFGLHVYVDGSSLFSAQAAKATFLQLAAQQGGSVSIGAGADSPVTVLFNPELKTSWVMVPGLIGLILTFIGTLITSIGLVRERESGTLEQLAVMPLRPSAIILGKITPYFLLAVADISVVTMLGIWLFGVPFAGNVWLFGLAAIVFCFVVLGIGVLISSISQNTGQAIQMAIMVVVPQVLLSGLIFPLGSMPAGVRWIGYLLPLTWFREVAQGIMLRAADLGTLWLPLAILIGMAVVAFGAATTRMRFSLTHGGAR